MRKQNRSKRLSQGNSSEGGSTEKFQGVQAERDLEANWEVDVAEKLEEYLLKICSGVTLSSEDVNFAEAALLLQGSAQVYSRKVEYLYGLVLRTLEYLSSANCPVEEDQDQGNSTIHSRSTRHVAEDDSDDFWNASDIPVESRNCLNASTSQSATSYHFVRPPSSLVVSEGENLDISPDGEELESFLLGTANLYRSFLLLDPSDDKTVDDYLKEDKFMSFGAKGNHSRRSAMSSVRKSSGSRRNRGLQFDKSPENLGRGDKNQECDHSMAGFHSFGMENLRPDDDGNDNNHDDYDVDDEDDPWKRLNPHDAGSLKARPFTRVKSFTRNRPNHKQQSLLTFMFPMEKVNEPVCPELRKIWERQMNSRQNSKTTSLYSKWMETLKSGSHCSSNDWNKSEPEDNDFDDVNDWEPDNVEHFTDENNDNLHKEKFDDFSYKTDDPIDPIPQTSLEDLCRSHLDALLANIAENEKQGDLVARVSSWKQKIEHNLEEQESRTPFDIHSYGERIISKLSTEVENDSCMSFSDVVLGQEKHDVARTFSALLQLINDREVQLDRDEINGETTCYSALNSFKIHLQGRERGRVPVQLSKKRVKSPLKKLEGNGGAKLKSLQSDSSKVSTKIGKVGGLRSTPDGKRRRRLRGV